MTTESKSREIWLSQDTLPLNVTLENVRARAKQFESQIKRRNARDYASFALIIVLFGVAMFLTGNLLLRVGSALVVAWAVYCVHGLYRFGAALGVPADAQTCASHHRRQLERQRDIVLSWPWGIGLAFPGIALFSLGEVWSAPNPDWTFPIALIGVFAFMFMALVMHGRAQAAQWQREIDALRTLESED